MAGLDDFDRVYRGRPIEFNDPRYGPSGRFPDREVIRPLDIPIIHPLAKDSPPPDDDLAVKRYIGLGCGLASLITENLLLHPFIVLRRQCQVNRSAQKYHLIPVTLIPVMARLHQTQGLNTLWKGIGSVLLVRGLTLAVEDLISKITPWPNISIGIVTPFYSASLVETVQSEIASEKPGILDVFRDGALRCLEVSNKGRLIPIYALLPPSIAYGVAKYLFALIVRGVTSRIMHIRRRQTEEMRGAYSRDIVSETVAQDIEFQSILISLCAADVIFYPIETVVHRLHLQGTRTIIDNLDTGRSVIPILTGYSGAIDCYRTIISTEGTLGLYKGFGALVFQFAVHFVLIKATKWILTEIGTVLKPKTKFSKNSQNFYNEA